MPTVDYRLTRPELHQPACDAATLVDLADDIGVPWSTDPAVTLLATDQRAHAELRLIVMETAAELFPDFYGLTGGEVRNLTR